MDKVEFNLQTKERTVIPLTPEEEAEFNARQAEIAQQSTPEWVSAKKDAEADALLSSPLASLFVEELASIRGETPGAVRDSLKPKLRAKL